MITVPAPTSAQPAPTRTVRKRRRQLSGAVVSTASVLFLLILWTAVSMSGKLPPGYLPTPLQIGDELKTLFTVGYKGVPIWEHIGISLFRALTGFIIGVAIGVPLGLFTGYSRIGNWIVSPVMAFVRPIPPIAFIPMVVLYFGLGELGKVVLIVWTAFNYVHVNAHAGAANVPIAYMRAARSIGLTPHQVFTRIVLPAAMPQIFTGLKVAMALSWAVVVAAELIGAQAGLGYMISDAALTFRITAVFVGIGLIGAIGLALNGVLNLAEARLIHWKGR
jgi:NitT/TauT family transport system permease protein